MPKLTGDRKNNNVDWRLLADGCSRRPRVQVLRVEARENRCVGILRRAELLAPNILDHLKEPVLFQEQSLTAILEEACTETVCPAKCVNFWIFVKIVAVFADVVQLNIHGGIMFPMALLRNPSPVPEIEVASPPQ